MQTNGVITIGGTASAILPTVHKGTDLGANQRAFDDIYFDDDYNQGALDFSGADVLAQIKAKPPRSKPAGSFDAVKESMKHAGLPSAELDPASLPLELTDYYKLKLDYDQNTNPVWVKANRLTQELPDGKKTVGTDKDAEDYIAQFKKEHADPATIEPQKLAISTNQMASFNYAAVAQLLDRVEQLEARVQELEGKKATRVAGGE